MDSPATPKSTIHHRPANVSLRRFSELHTNDEIDVTGIRISIRQTQRVVRAFVTSLPSFVDASWPIAMYPLYPNRILPSPLSLSTFFLQHLLGRLHRQEQPFQRATGPDFDDNQDTQSHRSGASAAVAADKHSVSSAPAGGASSDGERGPNAIANDDGAADANAQTGDGQDGDATGVVAAGRSPRQRRRRQRRARLQSAGSLHRTSTLEVQQPRTAADTAPRSVSPPSPVSPLPPTSPGALHAPQDFAFPEPASQQPEGDWPAEKISAQRYGTEFNPTTK